MSSSFKLNFEVTKQFEVILLPIMSIYISNNRLSLIITITINRYLSITYCCCRMCACRVHSYNYNFISYYNDSIDRIDLLNCIKCIRIIMIMINDNSKMILVCFYHQIWIIQANFEDKYDINTLDILCTLHSIYIYTIN